MISVLILTRDEAVNLPQCLQSVQWSDDIVVLDSYSTDDTVRVARDFGARVLYRKFDDEASHRTWALRHVKFRHPWVYNPDADEVATEELQEEMLEAVRRKDGPVAYRVRFKTIYFDKWLRWSSLYPTWVVRLFRPEYVSFTRRVNLEYIVHGPVGKLNEHFLHYTFRKGIAHWVDKHNRYSDGEALEARSMKDIAFLDLFTVNSVRRRRALKNLSWRLPMRPTLRFWYMWLLRLGFLDGWRGYDYCRLLSFYELLIEIKRRERKWSTE